MVSMGGKKSSNFLTNSAIVLFGGFEEIYFL